MARLSAQLKYFIAQKVTSDARWRGVKVIFSGHEVRSPLSIGKAERAFLLLSAVRGCRICLPFFLLWHGRGTHVGIMSTAPLDVTDAWRGRAQDHGVHPTEPLAAGVGPQHQGILHTCIPCFLILAHTLRFACAYISTCTGWAPWIWGSRTAHADV